MHVTPKYNRLENAGRSGLDDAQFEELYTNLSKYCQFLTRNKWDGEDLAQEAFYKAIKHYEQKTELNPRLLKKIAYNSWMDMLRKNSKETITAELENLEGEPGLNEITCDVIEELVSKLTPKQLVILTLRDAFQYKITEIADLIQSSETAVKATLHRLRARLKKLSKEENALDISITWTEQLKRQVANALYHSITVQDPELLLKVVPIVFSQTPATFSKPKMQLQTKHVRTTSTPPTCLSLAA
ncbi:sigma-70 family RNA polymerase sigma factor [Anaerobacillus sp. CMMVII]|uniref:sigma-70 family RNA polymerase sigma factor n=1 Tax=Anaerobacillus sp. CMMVII TaxID=2755588 RepID=UPI0021B74F25|nr:sigma-70 family RNA polymerase sigma factor [Anaerobacillus sp. CMMVII]MCT8139134.1 sigma-70 family RNA polymerase sigma factor [Anaerobacillus sp. CMMVII]